jgi:flavin reductase (DIM6/NTAB) family NADH-FMN oxidoreductase RutF
MTKIKLGVKNCLYPLPTTLVGANVDGTPNYIAIAHVGVMALKHVSLSMNKRHYTNAGIVENGTFSVNLPSVEMVEKTDYCGLVSGKDVDKAALFGTFYGTLGTAPMIAECPISMECKVVKTVDMTTHDVFIGEIVETYCDEACLDDGVVDFCRVQPILFVMNDRSYWRIGDRFAKAWQAGKALKG